MDKCYEHDYHDPCQPDRPTPRPGDPFCHPGMPDPFAPCDKPGFMPPPPPFVPMNPVPSVAEGASLYEAVNNLTNRVNVCMDTYNHVMAENYKTLHNLQRAAAENGAYYGPGEVWVEEGYYADESATYHLVHKAVVDRRGEPIRMELHLAYGNTTNSKIEQDIFSASKVTFADKILIAQPKGEDGWYGRAIWKGCPIASSDSTDLYTVGFTKSGHMRVYQNSVSVDQMLRDTIENAMGCSGILIQNGQLCDDSYVNTIPNWDKQVERVVMGQNLDTKEVIFLVCGDEDDVHRKGLTSKAAAKILLGYGCDIAVELCESTDAGAADKGSLMFVPKENKVPTAYAYWVISRKRFYKTDYDRELAELIQNYARCIWDGYLNKKRIEQVKAELDQEILDRIAGDEQLQKNLDEETRQRIAADEVLQENIDKETERAKGEEARIEGRLDDEIQRATSEEQRIEGKLDDEIARAKSEEQRIETKLDEEITRAKSEETRIETKLDEEIERSTTEDKRLDDKIDQEIHDRTNEDAKLHQEILTEQGERIAADEVLQTNINSEAATRASEDQRISDELTDKITKEQTERIAADNTLQANIDAEATTRASEDVRVTNELTEKITAETTARTEADKTLQSNIDKEASTRASEDTRVTNELTQLVNTEVENRTNADSALGARIDALVTRVTACEGDITKLQELSVKLQQQMTALDTSVTEILHTIADIETAMNNVKVSITNLTNTVNQIIDGSIELPYVKKAGDTMTGPLQMADSNGTVKGSLSAGDDGVSIAGSDGTYVKAGPDKVTVGGNDGKDVIVSGVADGVADSDGVNVGQLNKAIEGVNSEITALDDKYVKKSGDTMTGDLLMVADGEGEDEAKGFKFRQTGTNRDIGGIRSYKNAGEDVVEVYGNLNYNAPSPASLDDPDDDGGETSVSTSMVMTGENITFKRGDGYAPLKAAIGGSGDNDVLTGYHLRNMASKVVANKWTAEQEFIRGITVSGSNGVKATELRVTGTTSLSGATVNGKLSGVTAGTANSDAVNVKQLKDAIAGVSVDTSGLVQKSGDTMTGKLTVNADEDVNGTLKAIAANVTGPITGGNFVTIPSGYAYEVGAYQYGEIGGNLRIEPKSGSSTDNKVQVWENTTDGHQLQLDVNGSDNTRTSVVVKESGTISLGHDEMSGGSLVAGNVKVTGVADGESDYDAVNFKQLSEAGVKYTTTSYGIPLTISAISDTGLIYFYGSNTFSIKGKEFIGAVSTDIPCQLSVLPTKNSNGTITLVFNVNGVTKESVDSLFIRAVIAN